MAIVNKITKVLKSVMGEKSSASLIRLAQSSLPTFGHNFRFATANEISELKHSTIGNLLLQHKGLKVRKWLHYIEIYDAVFEEIKLSKSDGIRFLEIGVADGGSLQIWKKYFGPTASIIGIDIDPLCSALPEVGPLVRIGSQTDAKFLHSVVLELGGLDVVLDDGSHVGQDQLETFVTLWPLLESGGFYIVEDLHASYWSEFNPDPTASFLQHSVALIESMYLSYTQAQKSRIIDAVGSTISSIQFFDSIIVIKKGPRREPLRVTFP
jgi:23S rRNA U2552 (ribose-2'-O)-methylase RlmE/FtsJ